MNTEREHPTPTKKGKRYLFTSKHHGAGKSDEARWHPSLSDDEEFSVFDGGDFHDIYNESGRYLYGIFRKGKRLCELGTWHQFVAEFPKSNEAWHGYPVYPVTEPAPPNRTGDDAKPSREVFEKLEASGLISKQERKRLWKGRHA